MQNIFHTSDYSLKNLSALIPKSYKLKRLETVLRPMAAPLGAESHTPSRAAWFHLRSRPAKNGKELKENRATLKLRAMPIPPAAWKAAVPIGKRMKKFDAWRMKYGVYR
jgi:hypothetical protein